MIELGRISRMQGWFNICVLVCFDTVTKSISKANLGNVLVSFLLLC